MSRLPYYKAYPRDFIEKTVGMPFELKCAYRVVLDLLYIHGGRLPDDARHIAGQLNCSVRKWNSIRAALIEMGKLKLIDGFLANYRVDKELESLRKTQDKQAENARGPRKNKGLQKPRLSHTEPEPEPEYTVPYGTDADGVEKVEIDLPSEPETEHQRATKAVWQRGPAFLAECGVPKGSARSVIGKWLKDSSPQAVFDALADAKKCGTQDPVSYITKALQKPEITGADIQDMVAQIVKEMPKP